MKRRSGFTLIEILVVVGIIGVLISILMPSLASARRNSRITKCKANLHTIGVAMQAYLNSNRETFPWCLDISPPPNDPPPAAGSPEAKLVRLPVALKNEMGAHKSVRNADKDGFEQSVGKNAVYECPEDRVMADDYEGQRYFDKEFISYQWTKVLNGQKVNFKKVLYKAKPPYDVMLPVDIKIVPILQDFEPWHRPDPKMKGSYNILYADMHVDEAPPG